MATTPPNERVKAVPQRLDVDSYNNQLMQRFLQGGQEQPPLQVNTSGEYTIRPTFNQQPLASTLKDTKKRDVKNERKHRVNPEEIHQQDSILGVSAQHTANLLGSPNSSARRKTRGLGKKTIVKQSTMALDNQLTVIKQKTSTV